MAPTSGPSKFVEGERILCFHGPLIYEAKCLKFRVNPKDSINEYWVHYAGWNKNWDEWVPETRILKYNDNNVSRQKELQRSHKSIAQKKPKGGKLVGRLSGVKDSKPADARSEGSVNDPDSRSSTPILDPRPRIKGEKRRDSPTSSQDSATEGPKKSKRAKQEAGVETESQFVNKVEVRIKIPDELKPWLVDDMVALHRKKKFFTLPANQCVDKILESYVLSKKGKGNSSIDRACTEVSLGIKEYFNAMLGSKLLYKVERQQYQEIIEKHSGLLPSQIYGAPHLLRLFLKLGAALVYTTLNEKSMALLLATVHDILKYLASNIALYFSVNNYA